MFERETRREKILDARHREMKIKERAKSSADKDKVNQMNNFIFCQPICTQEKITLSIYLFKRNMFWIFWNK